MKTQDRDKLEMDDQVAGATLENLFPSPLMHFDWPASESLNERLRQILLEVCARRPGVVKTNRGGWQSDTNLETWEYPEIEMLKDRIIQLAREYVARILGERDPRHAAGWSIRAWANINQKGHFNRSHDHLGRNSFFSGVYYVDVGDIDEHGRGDGRTVFEDRTYVATSVLGDRGLQQRDVKMLPKNGRMLLFPASLMHRVESYTGDRPRITIAFNLFHPAFAVARLAEREQSADWMWANFRGIMILKRKIPEKLLGVALIPRLITSRPLPRPLSLRALRAHTSTAIAHAFALASERFEPRKED